MQPRLTLRQRPARLQPMQHQRQQQQQQSPGEQPLRLERLLIITRKATCTREIVLTLLSQLLSDACSAAKHVTAFAL